MASDMQQNSYEKNRKKPKSIKKFGSEPISNLEGAKLQIDPKGIGELNVKEQQTIKERPLYNSFN